MIWCKLTSGSEHDQDTARGYQLTQAFKNRKLTMLQRLKLQHVGPAPELQIELASRTNLLTGDNGLGKTFLLDIAWWALTCTWARAPAAPQRGADRRPAIDYRFSTANGPHQHRSEFDRQNQTWTLPQQRPASSGMVIYAQVDGGFSVWDPARNHPRATNPEGVERPPAFLFDPSQTWHGLPIDKPERLCNGLILDWASWQRENGQAFAQLRRALTVLSPSSEEILQPGPLTRVALHDLRDHPTLKMPYGQDVPLIHASAGMRRVVAFAYLLVWTWQEHLRASELLGSEPLREVTFLIDEAEAHLHPQWQRTILRSLLAVMEALTEQNVAVQVLVVTHSPLLLASVEPLFDPQVDALWTFDLIDSQVELSRDPWHRRGDTNAWLTSNVFELAEPRSLEAEQAILRALSLTRGENPDIHDIRQTDAALRAVLGDIDPFWVRWRYFVENQERQH